MGEESKVYLRVFKKLHFPIIAVLPAAPVILSRDPETDVQAGVIAPNKPRRADFPAMPRQLAWVCKYIFLTIKQTSRLAEHCRENDITAEF